MFDPCITHQISQHKRHLRVAFCFPSIQADQRPAQIAEAHVLLARTVTPAGMRRSTPRTDTGKSADGSFSPPIRTSMVRPHP
jgi:hypothetical protein